MKTISEGIPPVTVPDPEPIKVPVETVPPEEPKKGNSGAIIIGAILMLAVLMALMYYQNLNKPKE